MMLKRFIALIMSLSLSGISEAAYSFYRSVTIDHTKVPNTDQAAFTFLVCANGSSPCNASVSGLNQSGAGAKVQNANGYDIGFFTDTGCTTKVTGWDIDRYVASTGELEAWVNAGTVSHTSDTVVYLCYDDSGISTYQSTRANAYDSHTKAVAHFGDGSTLDDTETISGGLGRDSASAVAGQIAGGIERITGGYMTWDGTSPSTVNITFSASADHTISFWHKKTTANNSDPGNNRFFLTLGSSNFEYYSPYSGDNNLYWDDGGTGNGRIFTSYTAYLDAWTYVVLNGKGDNSFGAIYLNGVQKATRSVGQTPASGTHSGWITPYVPGATDDIDEYRIADAVRSADWVATEYNNQSSPGTFITFGTETAVGGGGGSPATATNLPLMGI